MIAQQIAELEQEIEAVESAIDGSQFMYENVDSRYYHDAFLKDSIYNYRIKLRDLRIKLANLEDKANEQR